MKQRSRIVLVMVLGLVMLLLAACGDSTATIPPAATPTATAPVAATATPKANPTATATTAPATPTALPATATKGSSTSTPSSGSRKTITQADNGKTVNLKKDEVVLIMLGQAGDSWYWTTEFSDKNVVIWQESATVPMGAQSFYRGNQPGRTTLTATPECMKGKTCSSLPADFKADIIVS